MIRPIRDLLSRHPEPPPPDPRLARARRYRFDTNSPAGPPCVAWESQCHDDHLPHVVASLGNCPVVRVWWDYCGRELTPSEQREIRGLVARDGGTVSGWLRLECLVRAKDSAAAERIAFRVAARLFEMLAPEWEGGETGCEGK